MKDSRPYPMSAVALSYAIGLLLVGELNKICFCKECGQEDFYIIQNHVQAEVGFPAM